MKQLFFSLTVAVCTVGFSSISAATTYQCSYRQSASHTNSGQNQVSGHFRVGTYVSPAKVTLNLLDSLYLNAEFSAQKKINFEIFTSDYEGDHDTLFVSSTDSGADDLSFSYKYNGTFYTVNCEKIQNQYQGYGGGCFL